MFLNSVVFPAPQENKIYELKRHLNDIIFVPKKTENNKEFHIPCFYQESNKNPKTNKIFLYFHGNAEDIFNSTSNINIIKTSLPFHTISMEYPGYSIYYQDKSAQIIEEDSLIVFDFLVKECKMNPKNIILCGRSIGSGAATYLASKRKPGGLILISPILSIQNAASSILGKLKFIVKDRFNNFERIKDVTCPTLIIHGQKDSLIPFQHSIILAERTSGPYELVLPEGMTHNDMLVYEDFLDPITSFLKRYNLMDRTYGDFYINPQYLKIPDYLNDTSLSNKDKTSEIIRKFLKI